MLKRLAWKDVLVRKLWLDCFKLTVLMYFLAIWWCYYGDEDSTVMKFWIIGVPMIHVYQMYHMHVADYAYVA